MYNLLYYIIYLDIQFYRKHVILLSIPFVKNDQCDTRYILVNTDLYMLL